MGFFHVFNCYRDKMNLLNIVLFWSIKHLEASLTKSSQINPDIFMSMEELVRKNGYPFEVYSNILTEDNYFLDIHRIPHGATNKTSWRSPILLVHGLTGSGRNFVAMGPKRGLAYLLADRGYDVWLANVRGTRESRKHLTLNPDTNPEYWYFSWHEIGIYDLPAICDLIKNVTKKEKIAYIGHSQGTTSFYVWMSERPQYNKYISIMISLAPQAYMKHFYNPFTIYQAAFEPIYRVLTPLLGLSEIPPKHLNNLAYVIVQVICSAEGFLRDLCAATFYSGGGYDPEQLNKEDLSTLVAVFPSFAANQLLHYAQNINSGEFKQFDFGRNVNIKKYGSVKPPAYNLTKVTSPVALYYGEEDWLVHPKDVDHLCTELSKCVHKYAISHRKFNHFDFLIAKDVVQLVYKDVFRVLKKYSKKSLY